jgi:hypothetical protein
MVAARKMRGGSTGKRNVWALRMAAALVLGLAGCGSVGASKVQDSGAGGSGSGLDGGLDRTAAGDGAPGGISGADGAASGGAGGVLVDAAREAIDSAGADGGGCSMLPSCAALHACDPSLASGTYMIAPDGLVDAGPATVHCDMETAGGGWTVIYLADSSGLFSTTIDYTVRSQRLRDNSLEALIAFRNLNLDMVASDWASFGLPATWRTKNPLAVTPFEDLTVSASVNGALPALAQLRYGTANFGQLCSDAWVTTTNYGRLCLQGTDAAFFSGFAIAGADLCSLSTQSYATRGCSDMIRFSIAVR